MKNLKSAPGAHYIIYGNLIFTKSANIIYMLPVRYEEIRTMQILSKFLLLSIIVIYCDLTRKILIVQLSLLLCLICHYDDIFTCTIIKFLDILIPLLDSVFDWGTEHFNVLFSLFPSCCKLVLLSFVVLYFVASVL